MNAKAWLYGGATVTAIAMLISIAVLKRPEVTVGAAVLDALAPSVILGVIGLAARYPCRAMPLRHTKMIPRSASCERAARPEPP